MTWQRTLLLLLFLTPIIVLKPVALCAETHTVRVVDFTFDPSDLKILPGDTVEWQWDASNTASHDVVAGAISNKPPMTYQEAFKSELRATAYTFSQTFDNSFLNSNPSSNGVYQYFCTPHQFTGMLGSITVMSADRAHTANLTGWQLVPDSGSSASASCELTVAADDSEVSISCSHQVANASTASIYTGAIGENGTEICSFSGVSISNQTCATTSTQVASLLLGEMYIVIRSSSNSGGELRGQFAVKNGSASIEGVVRDQNNFRVQGVEVSAGTSTASTDILGRYSIENVPNGVYRLSASLSNATVQPKEGTNPAFVNNVGLTSRDFIANVQADPPDDGGDDGGDGNDGGDDGGGEPTLDTDGDGVDDNTESSDGSDPNDRGSFKNKLQSPLYVLWNGFLRMVNILEILNTGNESLSVNVKLYNISGALVSQTPVTVLARGQVDVIINDLSGFKEDSFGVLALEFSNDRRDDIEGRVFFYRPDLEFGGFEFAFGVPFVAPTTGSSSVGFNTFQPSNNPSDIVYSVFQWLALVNLDPNASKDFTIKTYDVLGGLLDTRSVSVPPFGRLDLSAGHVNPGPSKVGQHVIIPSDNSAPYMAQLFRYGSNASVGGTPTRYFFAFPLLARAGNGRPQSVPISNGGGAENWLELINALDESVSVGLRFYDSHGMLRGEDALNLGPHSQIHIHASRFLNEGQSGVVLITPSKPNSIVGQTMFYFRDSLGSIEAMYGSGIRESFGRSFFGSYNRFIGMQNWLKISNVSSGAVVAVVKVFNQQGLLKETEVPLGPYATEDLGIHDSNEFNTIPDTFGVIEIETGGSKEITAELLRFRVPNSGTGVDFAAPTPVR